MLLGLAIAFAQLAARLLPAKDAQRGVLPAWLLPSPSRPFLLWLLYWQGTHPDALHFGVKVALAAAVPMAGHYEGGAHGGQFDGFALSLMVLP